MVIDPASPTRHINRRLLLSLHQDGLLDILGGLIVATFGLIPILDETGINTGIRQLIILSFYGISVLLIIWLKNRITLPRSGYVKLSRKTSTRLSLIMLIVNVLLFLIFAGVYVFKIPLWDYFGSYQMAIPLGLIFLVMFSVSGGLLKAPRFHLYGIIVLLSFIGFEHLYLNDLVKFHGIPPAAFISGGLIIISGLFHLFTFIHKYSTE